MTAELGKRVDNLSVGLKKLADDDLYGFVAATGGGIHIYIPSAASWAMPSSWKDICPHCGATLQ